MKKFDFKLWSQSLNTQQIKAVKLLAKPLLVKAGPGTGKTKTLTAKLVYLLKKQQVSPKKMVALTFTNKAAQEMKQRVQVSLAKINAASQISQQVKLPFIGTFHQLSLNLVKKQPKLVTGSKQQLFLRQALSGAGALAGQLDPQQAGLMISRFKNQTQALPPQFKPVYESYQQLLTQENLIDFTDLLLNLRRVLHQGQVKPKYQYVLVDEFQDINSVQYQLVKLLAKQAKQLFVIGDPHQAIYSFRGAQAQVFEVLAKDFPDLEEFTLTKNYRSFKKIVQTASSLFSGFKQEAVKQESGTVQVITTHNQYTEADWIINHLNQTLGGTDLVSASGFHNQGQQASFKDFAIIYRLHSLSRTIKTKLRDTGLPFQCLSAESLYQRPTVKLVVDLLKWSKARQKQENPTELFWQILTNHFWQFSDKTLLAILKLAQALNQTSQVAAWEVLGQRLLSSKQESKLKQLLTALEKLKTWPLTKPLPELIQAVWEQLALEANLDLVQLKNNASAFANLDKFLHYLTNLSQFDYYDQQADKISLLTMHAAKGLEFKYVYLLGCEQDFLPFLKSTDLDQAQRLAEEKRLFYVALTRAKQAVFLLQAKQRFSQDRQPSPFLKALAQTHLEKVTDPQLLKRKKAQENQALKDRQASLF